MARNRTRKRPARSSASGWSPSSSAMPSSTESSAGIPSRSFRSSLTLCSRLRTSSSTNSRPKEASSSLPRLVTSTRHPPTGGAQSARSFMSSQLSKTSRRGSALCHAAVTRLTLSSKGRWAKSDPSSGLPELPQAAISALASSASARFNQQTPPSKNCPYRYTNSPATCVFPTPLSPATPAIIRRGLSGLALSLAARNFRSSSRPTKAALAPNDGGREPCGSPSLTSGTSFTGRSSSLFLAASTFFLSTGSGGTCS